MQQIEIALNGIGERASGRYERWMKPAAGYGPVDERHIGDEINRQRDRIFDLKCRSTENEFTHTASRGDAAESRPFEIAL